MADIELEDDDEEAAAMEESDLEDENDEVFAYILVPNLD